MTINEQAIKAAKAATRPLLYMLDPCATKKLDWIGFDAEKIATEALEAAMPHIREQIAEEINNIEEPPDDQERRYTDGWSDAMTYAAYIARGEP